MGDGAEQAEESSTTTVAAVGDGAEQREAEAEESPTTTVAAVGDGAEQAEESSTTTVAATDAGAEAMLGVESATSTAVYTDTP